MSSTGENNTTRRQFVKQAIAAGMVLVDGSPLAISAARIPPVILNHVGYIPNGSKFFLQDRAVAGPFYVIDAATRSIVYRGKSKVVHGEFGAFATGQFSNFTTEGTYVLKVGGANSEPFKIGADAYSDSIQNGIDYFSSQRCGNSTTGYHSPCHLDDGRRLDNGAHQDVTGGWHDACDVRKWVDSTIYGMVGLTRVLNYFPTGKLADKLINEVRWGNLYFRNMQESAGYIMNYCAGDDGNYFTDNTVGTSDDRPIHTEPASLRSQFHFIASQAMLVRYVQATDLAYAHGCQDAADLCLGWMTTSQSPTGAGELAAGVMACTQMFITTQNTHYRDLAARYGRQLIALQQVTGTVTGFFYSGLHASEPYRDSTNGNLPMLALCDLLETFPTHANAPSWQAALALHGNLLVTMSARSALGIVPYGFYASGDPGGNKKSGDFWYRWFQEVSGSSFTEQFWVGINSNLASTGIGLSRAASLLKNKGYASLAQRQLDWIVGCNPFNASTVIGSGHSQPTLYHQTLFKPATPLINGGVMNGIGGTVLDQPNLADGTYHTCEYYTPMVAYTTWLMAELQEST